MRIFRDIREADLPGPTFLTIGNFDGLHRGHQRLLARLRDNATAMGASSAILTFHPHPLTVLRPGTPLELLTSPEERLALASDLGIDVGIIQPFTPELAQLGPRAFLELLINHLGLIGLTAGLDFALGRNRAGTLDVLAQLGQELGFALDVVQPVQVAGEEVRSYTIRQALRAGQVERVSGMLGRDYSISGVVVEGDRRGRTVGIPTANLRVAEERLLPGDGVYATWAWIGDPAGALWATPRLASVTNIGMRPTVGGKERRVECHLFDFPPPEQSGDLYGKSVTLAFVQRLRTEERFANLDALVAQIQRDMAAARAVLQSQ
ncbi:MAG: bifunctional riboflavin kinase/FAD synthetase [Chloroflexi bacterium]|nr:bifunctional riboflavin kinase/FAD synthetase [Chloroflexota bacterium]